MRAAAESVQSLPGISGVRIDQEPRRERDAPGSAWPEKLDTRRKQRVAAIISIVETCRHLSLPIETISEAIATLIGWNGRASY